MSEMAALNFEDYPNRINAIVANKTILLTGGTGFVGKVFIEKLLRDCPHVKKIYVMVRTRKNKEPKERMEEIFKGPLFDMLKKQRGGDILKKVEAISADMEAIDLDLSSEDRKKLIDEVEMIYHSAATVRFDAGLKKSVFINARGTKLMLELAKECRKLMIFVHVSTAYCHPKERVLYEKAYPPPANPHHLIKICELVDENILDTITDKILEDIPNTYTLTKALGEALVNDEMDSLPVIILRPSVAVPIWKDPIPGWTDNINGPMGLFLGAGKGVIRTMYCKGEIYVDYVPVDIVASYLLCTAFIYFQSKKRFYNLTTSNEIKMTFGEIIRIGQNIVLREMPFNGILWYPGGSIKRWRWLHNVEFVLFQLIPALILDRLMSLLGYKPFLTRVQKRIWKSYVLLEFYANTQWDFNNDELLAEVDKFNPREKAIFKPTDSGGINYHDYFLNCIHGLRLYFLKETDDTIPSAKRHTAVLWFVDRICKTLFLLGVLYLVYKHVFIAYVQTL